MPEYHYGRVRVLARAMTEFDIAQDVMDQIMEGGDKIKCGTTPDKKAEWLAGAMHRMDTLIDADTRHAIRESCACCLGGKRQQISRSIARNHGTLEERVAAANEAKFVFGHSVTMQDKDTIIVQFAPDGQEEYRCSCLPKVNKTMSITYCYCCGGHAKHHLQNALGLKLSCKVLSSPLSSGGKQPCRFQFVIEG